MENEIITAYRELFAEPGTRGFALAGLLARMPLPIAGIGIITMLAQLHGNYALAGTVSGTFVLTYALLSPYTSRMVDRYGQSRVLPIVTMISVVGLLILLVSTWREFAEWTLFVGALLTGFMPSISAMVRARWTAIYRGQQRLQTAYSLESVFDEFSFIAGPPISVGLSVAVFPQAGLLVAAVLLAIGVGVLIMQRGSEPPIEMQRVTRARSTSVIRLGSVRLLILLMVSMGVIVGTVDIVSVAFAEQLGRPTAASLVLSAYALGSCAAGLLFGALKLRMPLHLLLLLGAIATAATTLPLLLANSIVALAVSVLVAGLFFAPTMIVAMSLVERLVPETRLTEGMAWLLAGLNVGVALGAMLAGQVVEDGGAHAGFSIAVGAGVLVLLIAMWSYARLRAVDLPCVAPSLSRLPHLIAQNVENRPHNCKSS